MAEHMFPTVERRPQLTDSRLASLYEAQDVGAEKTMRAKVIRELIDEMRALRRELEQPTVSHACEPSTFGEG